MPPPFDPELVRIIAAAAGPIPPSRRPAFLEMIDERLRGEPLTPAAVRVACAEVQREFRISAPPAVDAPSPDLDAPRPTSTPRSRYERRAR
jgi:hypothetical protein